jgi:hypothetical protein
VVLDDAQAVGEVPLHGPGQGRAGAEDVGAFPAQGVGHGREAVQVGPRQPGAFGRGQIFVTQDGQVVGLVPGFQGVLADVVGVARRPGEVVALHGIEPVVPEQQGVGPVELAHLVRVVRGVHVFRGEFRIAEGAEALGRRARGQHPVQEGENHGVAGHVRQVPAEAVVQVVQFVLGADGGVEENAHDPPAVCRPVLV